MCQGTTKKGKPCKNKAEPFCRFHTKNPLTIKFLRGPTKADGPGYIYIYSVDLCDKYYKIGSSVDPTKRVKQWKGITKKIYYVHHRQFAERLIHLAFDAIRVFRYKMEEEGKYCTVWKATNEPVEEEDAILKETQQLHGFQKHVEWFKTDWLSIKARIEEIVNMVNDRMLH